MKMKTSFIILLLASCFISAQDVEQKKLFHLKNDYSSSQNSKSNSIVPQFFESKKKNTGLAIIYSLLLPGMGELYAESYESGKHFTITEGVLWGSYLGINTYGNWQKERYKSFAASKGGVNLDGKDNDYFATIGEYLSIEQYNNQKALERNLGDMLNENKYYWKWTSEDRKAYRRMWVSSEQAFNSLRFVVGALIINRIASAINAVRLVSKYNKQQSKEISWTISAGIDNSFNIPNHIIINFQTSF